MTSSRSDRCTHIIAGHRLEELAAGGAHARVRHALSIDVEDWQQSVLNHALPVSLRFVASTRRLLELLDRHKVRATFFVLGNAAKKAPELVRDIHAAGHEVQTHGYDHREVHTLSPESFRDDVLRAKGMIEDLIGTAVTGYRAPRFSIDHRTLWALDVLAACGFRYDSSIFGMRIRGYGIAGWPTAPHRITTPSGAELIEVPVSIGSLAGRPLPIGGGGYLRLMPAWLIKNRLREIARAGRPIVLYCHPYELDVHAFREIPHPIGLATRLHQGIGKRGMARKLDTLLAAFSPGTIGELIAESDRGDAQTPNPHARTCETVQSTY